MGEKQEKNIHLGDHILAYSRHYELCMQVALTNLLRSFCNVFNVIFICLSIKDILKLYLFNISLSDMRKVKNLPQAGFKAKIFPQKCVIPDCFQYMKKGFIFNSQAQLD